MTVQSARSISLPCDAGQDLPQRRFVAYSATGCVLPADGGGAAQEGDVIGVSLEAYDDSEFALGNASNVIPVALLDGAVLEVEAGAEAITVGAAVSTDGSGRAKPADATGDEILGVAKTAVGAMEAGTIIEVIAQKAGRSATT